MQPNFDVFDHQMKVKVAEIFWGAPAPRPPLLGGSSPNPPPNPLSVTYGTHAMIRAPVHSATLFWSVG